MESRTDIKLKKILKDEDIVIEDVQENMEFQKIKEWVNQDNEDLPDTLIELKRYIQIELESYNEKSKTCNLIHTILREQIKNNDFNNIELLLAIDKQSSDSKGDGFSSVMELVKPQKGYTPIINIGIDDNGKNKVNLIVAPSSNFNNIHKNQVNALNDIGEKTLNLIEDKL